jgi:hypothetical protein
MSDTWDDEDRAIARALDASADADTSGADEQLVDEYRELLARLSPEITPRPDLEDDVMAAALARRPAVTPSVDRARRSRANRVRIAALAAAVVAAAVVVGLIVQEASTGTPAPTAHVALATVQRADVEALLRAPGTRTGSFRPVLPTRGRVALGTTGKGIVYDLRTDAPVSLGLISNGGTTVIGPVRATGGAIAFVVDHPERVTSVDLIRNGATIGRAELTSS